MTNYEAIQKMSVEEMASVFYMFLKPMMDNFNLSEEQKKKTKEQIKEFLLIDIKTNKKG